MKLYTWTCAAATLLIMTAPVCSASAGQSGHAHESLRLDPSLSLHEVVETALMVYPEWQVQQKRQEQADAWVQRGRSWLLNRPSLMLRYQTDRWGSDDGLVEYEAGIELPLWTWGGRSAVQSFGQALASESGAAAKALRWEVSGMVRMALWDIASAESAHELAKQSREMAARLLKTVERRHELGDIALRDVLLARSTYLDYQSKLIEANAELLDAERAYRAFTGLDRHPELVAETRSELAEIKLTHPALALAESVVQRAEAGVAVTRETSDAGATVLIGTRRERPAFGTMLDDSIGVTVNLPFAGSTHRKTAITEAARTAAEASATLNQQMRQLTLAMHEAEHSLTVIAKNLVNASQQFEVAEQQLKMAENAYQSGEIDLIDMLKIEEIAVTARYQLAQLQIDKKRQTALYNQASGELP